MKKTILKGLFSALIGGILITFPPKFEMPLPAIASGTAPYYLVGSINGWNIENTDYPLTRIGTTSLYTWQGELSANAEFKVRDSAEGWGWVKGWQNVFNAGSRVLGDVAIAASDNNIKVINTKTFIIRFDNSNDRIYITENISVSSVTDGSSLGVNENRMRLWSDRGVYDSGIEVIGIQVGNPLTDSSTIYRPSGYVERSLSYYYAYYDIPKIEYGHEVRLVRLDNNSYYLNYSSKITWASSNDNKVLAITSLTGTNLVSREIPDDQGTLKKSFLVAVLEGYLTCSASSQNGYGGFVQMRKTYFFFAAGAGAVRTIFGETISGNNLTDYAYGASYSVNRGTGIQVDALQKYNALAVAAGQSYGDVF